MTDHFREKAADWDQAPVPTQISAGVGRALLDRVALAPTMDVLDFGAGTGLLCAQVAPRVARVIAVDISASMLEQLRAKAGLAEKVDIQCRDILEAPLAEQVDLVVSAMAMHHVADTGRLLRTLYAHLRPGGRVALADLDAEDGSFHPPETPGVFHAGFDRASLATALGDSGFTAITIETACTVHREGRAYPIFLATATKVAG